MTVEQIQHLLVFFGYDTGGTEGTYGPKTERSVRDFQREYGSLEVDGQAGSDTQKALRKAVGEGWTKPEKTATNTPDTEANQQAWWKDIRYFTREEFRCPCGKWCNGFPVEPVEELVRQLDEMRHIWGMPIIIVPPDGHSGGSGVRCKEYNATLKGSAKNSYHLLGKAADFICRMPAATIEAELNSRKAAGQIKYWYRISTGAYHMEVY